MASQQLPLTDTVYRAITGGSCTYTVVLVVPGDDLLVHDDTSGTGDTTREIGIPKQMYLGIFREGHAVLGEICAGHVTPDVQLLALAALLLTTNDHYTAWRVHRQAVEQADRTARDQAYRFAVALATSRMARINKSLVLWHWIRTQFAQRGASQAEFDWLVKQTVKSMELHYANYSAGASLVWLANKGREMGLDASSVVRLLRQLGRRELGDVSVWSAMALVMAAGRQAGVARDELVWLEQVGCPVGTPFREMARVQNTDR